MKLTEVQWQFFQSLDTHDQMDSKFTLREVNNPNGKRLESPFFQRTIDSLVHKGILVDLGRFPTEYYLPRYEVSDLGKEIYERG